MNIVVSKLYFSLNVWDVYTNWSVILFSSFSSYGEGLFLTIQTSLIAFLILFFGNKVVGALLFIISYIGTMGYLLSGLCPISILGALQSINIPIVILSKVSVMKDGNQIFRQFFLLNDIKSKWTLFDYL